MLPLVLFSICGFALAFGWRNGGPFGRPILARFLRKGGIQRAHPAGDLMLLLVLLSILVLLLLWVAQRRGPQHARFWRDGVERLTAAISLLF
jgi:hypothetical protein